VTFPDASTLRVSVVGKLTGVKSLGAGVELLLELLLEVAGVKLVGAGVELELGALEVPGVLTLVDCVACELASLNIVPISFLGGVKGVKLLGAEFVFLSFALLIAFLIIEDDIIKVYIF
jgi:hypothetical protein